MHVWRLIIVLLLSVAVTSHGFASVGRHVDCKAQAHVASAEKSASPDSCCGDMGGHEHNSNDACAKLCGLGGDCGNANLLQTCIAPELRLTSHVRLLTGTPVHVVAFDPSGVWRPPRSH